MLLFQYIYIYIENGTKRKRQLPCVFCKQKKRKFVFLGGQTINSNRRLLFQQMCPSMAMCNTYHL